MTNELLQRISNDLSIKQYDGELRPYFESRLVYSAFAEWMRFMIFDNTTENHEQKSKKYILNRGQEILSSLISSSYPLQQWFCDDESGTPNYKKVIKEMRNRMTKAGEYIELLPSNDLSLPAYQSMQVNEEYKRIVGINPLKSNKNLKFVGITRLEQEIGEPSTTINFTLHQFINWIFNNAQWSEIKDVSKFEFFNPFSKSAPYKSWGDFPSNRCEHYLGRITLYGKIHEYYLFQKKHDVCWYVSPIANELCEKKEERRIILGLREEYNNQAIVKCKEFNNCVELKLPCRIPIREESVIETFSWPQRYYLDKLNYIVPIEVWSYIKNMIEENLGMKVEVL